MYIYIYKSTKNTMEEYNDGADEEDELAEDIAFVRLPHVHRMNVGNEPVHELYKWSLLLLSKYV